MPDEVIAITVTVQQQEWLGEMLAGRTEGFDDIDVGWQILKAVYDALPA